MHRARASNGPVRRYERSHSHAPPVLKELDRGRRGAEVEPLAPELPRDAVVVVLEFDMVVDADLRAHPKRELVGPGRQRTQGRPLDRLEEVAPRLAEVAARAGVEALEQEREQIAEIKPLFRGGAEVYRTPELGRSPRPYVR